jgi:hypothetical protein
VALGSASAFSDDIELTKADREVYARAARAQRFKRRQRILVDFAATRGRRHPDEAGDG